LAHGHVIASEHTAVEENSGDKKVRVAIPSIQDCGEFNGNNSHNYLLPYFPITLFPSKKAAFTLAEGASHGAMQHGTRKTAFTLAEVLITLGIIGIVAAMTLPALIQKNNNRIVETRLKKFYSSINQAVELAESEYGDKKDWFTNYTTPEEVQEWFMKYLGKNLKILKTTYDTNNRFTVYFTDGSGLKLFNEGTTRDWVFYPSKPDKCDEKYGMINSVNRGGLGICAFAFIYAPAVDMKYHYNKGFEPWKYAWSGDRTDLLSGCKGNGNYCTALIQMNNWKIPEDYPRKVSY